MQVPAAEAVVMILVSVMGHGGKKEAVGKQHPAL